MKKSFKDTKIGGFLAKAAPAILDTVGDAFPPAKILRKLIDDDQFIKPEDRQQLERMLHEYEIEEMRLRLEDRKDSRDMYRAKSEKADTIADSVMKWNLPVLMILVMINLAAIIWLDKALVAVISNIIGFALNALLNERSTVIQFFFGSSDGSKKKDEMRLKSN